ncbi:hypothetical protein GYMLUDRAFT_252632, partial [Collybiopsis luxurians FD-317 M1]
MGYAISPLSASIHNSLQGVHIVATYGTLKGNKLFRQHSRGGKTEGRHTLITEYLQVSAALQKAVEGDAIFEWKREKDITVPVIIAGRSSSGLHGVADAGQKKSGPLAVVAPVDVWGGPSSESFPFETKSDSTPNSLSNFVPSLDTTSLPSTLVETRNTSPVMIFSSGHPNAYFVRTGEDPLTYSLVEKDEDELVDPSLYMALSLQDIREQMEIE